MKKTIRLTLLIASVALAAGLAAAETSANVQNDWPLPIPQNIQINSPDDLKGVLIRWDNGSVFQIEDAVWEISPAGDLGYRDFRGYTRQGDLIEIHKAESLGTPVLTIGQLSGFRMGDPNVPDSIVEVDWIVLGTDNDGYLVVLEEEGYKPATGELVSRSTPNMGTGCGWRIYAGCVSNGKCAGPCGAQPGCACTAGMGGSCDYYHSRVCEGACPSGLLCYNNGGTCGCWENGPPFASPPSPGPGSGPGTTPVNPDDDGPDEIEPSGGDNDPEHEVDD